MPYCSLEEAWGSDFEEIKTKPTKFSKITPTEYEKNEYSTLDESLFNKKKPKRKKFSRGYNRLEKHSGPETRLPYNSTPYIIDDIENEPVEEKKTINERFSNNDKYIDILIHENKKLKDIISKYKTNSNDGIFDLVLFLASGVFIIFLLDTVTKGIKRF